MILSLLIMEGRDRDDFEGGNEAWGFTNWEKQCIEQLESQPDVDDRSALEKEQALQRLRNLFQNAATACAQLYKGNVFSRKFLLGIVFHQAHYIQSYSVNDDIKPLLVLFLSQNDTIATKHVIASGALFKTLQTR